jgi:hypothetical protein
MVSPCFFRISRPFIIFSPGYRYSTIPQITDMNLLKTLVITASLIISCNYLSAQKKIDTAGTEKKWYIKDALPVSDTQSLAIFEHKKDESGIVLVNNLGTIQWEQAFDGCVMAISKYKDHFLVFYAAKGYWDKIWGSYKNIKQINAATIDIKSQKIIDDKVIYTGSKFVITDFQNDPAGNFNQLLLRYSTSSDYKEVKGFNLITFNADGSLINKEINSIATGQKFIGSSAGKDGSFFISSIQNWSSIVVEKFSHDGMFISKQESPLTLRNDPEYYAVMRTDPATNNSVTLTINALNKDRDYAFSHIGFNFDNNQVYAVNEAPLAKKTTPYNFAGYRDLRPIDILYTTDKVIVVREVRYFELPSAGSSKLVTSHSRAAVVSVFDKQMKLQRDIILGKATSSYSQIDIGISCNIVKDKLYILSGENAGMGKFDNFCYKVNLNEGSYERKKIGLDKASMKTSLSTFSTMWLKNEVIITKLHIGYGIGPGIYSSTLERVGFDSL